MGGTFHERRLSGVRARDRVIPAHLFFGTRRGTACQLNDGALSIIGRSKSCKLTATAALRVGLFSGRPLRIAPRRLQAMVARERT